MRPAHRLQLAASRLEKLSKPARSVFIDRSWIHLGEPPEPFLKLVAKVFCGKRPWFSEINEMYRKTQFQQFWFGPGSRLQFDDASFTFVYSEHFFEHLSPELASELFKDCYRILDVGGVIRTVVPDAILRTYEPQEPEGFPLHLKESDPNKHKIRWTCDDLSKALEKSGFRPIPINYCTKDGRHVQNNPAENRAEYEERAKIPDWPIISDLSYVMRTPSLIVDGVKEA